MSSLLAAAPATAWPSGLRGPCLEMKNIILSSSCDSGQQRTTRFAFTMEQVSVYFVHTYACHRPCFDFTAHIFWLGFGCGGFIHTSCVDF